MPRSIWNGVISFGMVSIPVKLYTGTQNKDISFNMLHKEDNERIKMQRWCPADERTVEMSELVRGYEYARDQTSSSRKRISRSCRWRASTRSS